MAKKRWGSIFDSFGLYVTLTLIYSKTGRFFDVLTIIIFCTKSWRSLEFWKISERLDLAAYFQKIYILSYERQVK